MTDQNEYRRAQLIWALWRQFTEQYFQAAKEPPRAFETRTKKFLDMDREPELDVHGAPAFAFGDGEHPGKGTERLFTHFDGTCLAIAHEMMDSGLKQSEVVHVMKHTRPAVRHFYDQFMDGPDPVARSARHPKDFPGWPVLENKDRTKKVDWRVFMVLKRTEFTGRFSETFRKDRPEVEALYFQPDFCRGVDDLRAFLNEETWQFRKAYVGEIVRPARRLAAWLEKAPEIRRGRS